MKTDAVRVAGGTCGEMTADVLGGLFVGWVTEGWLDRILRHQTLSSGPGRGGGRGIQASTGVARAGFVAGARNLRFVIHHVRVVRMTQPGRRSTHTGSRTRGRVYTQLPPAHELRRWVLEVGVDTVNTWSWLQTGRCTAPMLQSRCSTRSTARLVVCAACHERVNAVVSAGQKRVRGGWPGARTGSSLSRPQMSPWP